MHTGIVSEKVKLKKSSEEKKLSVPSFLPFKLIFIGIESTSQAGDTDSTPGSGRDPRGGNGNSLQYSCLKNSMERGVWWATVHMVTKELNTTQQLNNNTADLQCCASFYCIVKRISFIYVYTHTHICIYIDIYICTHTYIYTYICTCIYPLF